MPWRVGAKLLPLDASLQHQPAPGRCPVAKTSRGTSWPAPPETSSSKTHRPPHGRSASARFRFHHISLAASGRALAPAMPFQPAPQPVVSLSMALIEPGGDSAPPHSARDFSSSRRPCVFGHQGETPGLPSPPTKVRWRTIPEAASPIHAGASRHQRFAKPFRLHEPLRLHSSPSATIRRTPAADPAAGTRLPAAPAADNSPPFAGQWPAARPIRLGVGSPPPMSSRSQCAQQLLQAGWSRLGRRLEL